MNYIVRLMNKSEFQITGEEYQKLANKSGLVHIPSANRAVNMSSIVEIVLDEEANKLKLFQLEEPKSSHKENLKALSDMKENLKGKLKSE